MKRGSFLNRKCKYNLFTKDVFDDIIFQKNIHKDRKIYEG